MEVEGKEKERVTVKSVLSRKTNIAIIIGWIITGIAIAFVWIWATSSPALETLVSMNISIGLATIMGIFSVTLKIVDRISRVEERMSDKLSEMSNVLGRMETVLVRTESLLRGR
ncbi:MAG: hypothetical protein ACXQTW_06635 [Candidatus Methanospirareceae archaeon]